MPLFFIIGTLAEVACRSVRQRLDITINHQHKIIEVEIDIILKTNIIHAITIHISHMIQRLPL